MDRGRQSVKFYGLIYFQCKDGYLAASGLDGGRLYLRTPSVVGDTADEALPFFGFADACVFRVVPTLSSRAATSSVRGASGAARSSAGSGSGGGEKIAEGSTASALGELSDAHYDPRKTADIIDVEEITYGKSFSLVHEASGLFVSVAHALPSENDPDCLSVVLVKPSAAMTPSCELTLVSRYKIHADGDKLCRADSVLVRLAASPMFLHVSAAPLMEPHGDNDGDIELLHRTFRFGSSITYAAKARLGPGGVGGAVAAAASAAQGSCLSLQGSFAMPAEHAAAASERCSTAVAAEALTREFLDEVNACEEGGVSFTLQRYDMGTDRANRQRTQLRISRPYVACGVPVALYHRERESFLMTSATQFSATTEAEEEREYERSNTTTPSAEDVSGQAVPGSPSPSTVAGASAAAAAAAGAARGLAMDGGGELEGEEGLETTVLKSRKRKSKLNGVAALGGAEAAIRHSTTAAANASRRGTPALASGQQQNVSFAEGNLAASFNATLQAQYTQQQQRHRAQSLCIEGLLDTGGGRRFPFPVFTAANPEGGAASEDLSLLDANHNCTTLWCFEHEEPMLGGPLRYGSSWRYRVRHVVSGMYLAVCGSAVDAMLADYNDEDNESDEAAAAAAAAALTHPTSPTSTASSTLTAAASSGKNAADEASGKGEEGDGDDRRSCAQESSSPPSDRTKTTARAATATAATVMEVSSAAQPDAAVPPTRETRLCLIPQPRSRKERESTLFCVEPMYATDSVYLIEQTCLSLKNVLTEMYVVTDADVEGSDVALSLDWQPSPADPIILSYVPHQLQLDTRFIATQSTWLARYRAEMQALLREHQRQRAEAAAAALNGSEEARQQLATEEAYRQSLPELIQPYYNTPDLDKELLRRHRGFGAAAGTTKKEWADALTATYGAAALAGNLSMSGRRASESGCARGFFGGDVDMPGVPRRPSYAAMHNTIHLCQRALIALIEFCSESDETNVLRREGLPIRSRQSLFYEMRFHRLLFDVIVAPFQLLQTVDGDGAGRYSSVVNSIAALMQRGYGSFDEIYETLRMAQQQQADMGCVWSGVWRSSAGGSGAAAANSRFGVGGACDGLLDERELLLPMHGELHLLTRLALRLLREMIRGSAATFTTGWSAHIPKLLMLDGLRLHVVDTMQELFTDNPFIPLQAVQQVSEHFISVSRQLRRGAYMDFLGAACTIKYKGVPERQAFVCQKLLVENPQALCRFVIVVPPGRSEAEGQVYILPSADANTAAAASSPSSGPRKTSSDDASLSPSAALQQSQQKQQQQQDQRLQAKEDRGIYTAPPPGFLPFTEFFSDATDKRQSTFVANQIALFARLCYDGCPPQCRDVVGRLFPPAAMKSLLRTFVWTGEQVVGHRCSHDVLRSFLIRLAMQCFVLPRMSAPAVQLRVSTVLFGSSQLRQHACPTYSGLPDDEMTVLLKTVVLTLLRANPHFVQDDTGRSLLMRGSVSVWLKLTRYRQYTHEEVLTVLPLLLQLLDGTQDLLKAGAASRGGKDVRWRGARGGAVGSRAQSPLPPPPPQRRPPPPPRRGASASAAASVNSTSRLVHKVESVHLMRIREMICQALFLALQHEVFQAADKVIVHLYRAYTQVDPSTYDGRAAAAGSGGGAWNAVHHAASALSSAAQMPAVAVKDLGSTVSAMTGRRGGNSGSGDDNAQERCPLLDPHDGDDDEKSSRREDADAQSSLAAQRQADGYHALAEGPQASFAVGGAGGGSGSQAQVQSSATFSVGWTSHLIRTEASAAFAALSSSSDDDDEHEASSVANASLAVGSPHAAALPGARGGRAGVSAAEVQALLDYHTNIIVEYFQPNRLVSYLFDVARYDCRPLTVQAMALLVQLCVVKRSIAQLVLKVNTLPSFEVLRSFDRMYDVAVQLREACAMPAAAGASASRSSRWEAAIQATLTALNGSSAPAPHGEEAEAAAAHAPPAAAAGSAAVVASQPLGLSAHDTPLPQPPHHTAEAKRAANFRRMYESFRGVSTEDFHRNEPHAAGEDDDDEDEEESGEEEREASSGGGGGASGNSNASSSTKSASAAASANAEEASLSTSMRLRRKKERIAALWSKTSGAVRMLVYNNTIRNRRRALGLSETSTIPVNVIIRAEMMAHWRIHESLLQMLSHLTSADAAFKSVLQFFYFFSFSESNSLLLQPYVSLFLEKLDAADATATVCLHIIVRVLRSNPHVEDYLTPELLEAVASHINDELYTKLPDPELVEMLSQYIFSKSAVSPVVRRRMMILFREHGTLMNLARFRLSPTPVEVVFTSALVNLVCSICGAHTSVLTLARSMLPAENICNVILQKRIVETLPTALVDGSRRARVASRAADTSATPSAVAALKLLNPYVRILVALYFIPKNDSRDDSRRRCLLWMGNPQMWGVVHLFTAAMEAVSNAIEEDGTKRVVNRGIGGVKVYRTLLCSTIPLALAGFLINCFSNEGFNRYHAEMIGNAFYELAAAAERFGALLMQHVAALQLTVEEVVNYRRFLGTLYHRLTELRDDTNGQLEELAERCYATKHFMRTWLSEQQQELEATLVDVEDARAGAAAAAGGRHSDGGHEASPATIISSAASFTASFAGARKPRASSTPSAAAAAYLNTLRRRQASNDDDMSAFRLLFAEEAVSQAQLHSQEVLEAAGLSGSDSRSFDLAGRNSEPEGADTNGLNNIGLLLPGVLACSRGVSAARASLRATLRGDTIIPSVRRSPSDVSMIAVQHLLRSAHDEAMRDSIACVLEAMREHLFRPRTFVGIMNLFANALDTALHYPDLVRALGVAGGTTTTTATGGSASAAGTPLARSPSQRATIPGFDAAGSGDYGAGGTASSSSSAAFNPDGAIARGSLGYAMQTTFNDTGMLNVVISLCGLEEDVISLNAIRLGVLILEGGNRHAQTRLLDYFLTREEGFFHNVRDILQKNVSWVENVNAEHQYYLMKRGMRGEETKSAVAAANIQIINALAPPHSSSSSSGRSNTAAVDSNLEVFTASRAYVASLHGDHRKWLNTLSSATQVSGWARVRGSRRLKLITFLFRLIQLFCEGHFAGLQNYVRAQHDNLHSANVIIETMAFMEEVATFVTPSNYRVLSQGFELLTEVCQGPCRLNQEALIDYGVCRVIRHIVDYLQAQSGGDRHALTALLQRVSGDAQAGSRVGGGDGSGVRRESLESDMMNRLREEEASQLRVSLSNTLLAVLEGCREAEAYRRVLRQIPLTSVAVEVQHAFNPVTMHLLQHNEEQFESDDRMEAMFNWLIYLKSVEPYAEMEGVLEGVQTLLRSSQAVSRYLGSVEIRRADGLERVYFRIPLLCRSLTQERKDELLWSVDRTSRATKLADFLHMSDEIIFAVEWNHAFHNRIARWTRCAIPYYDEAAGNGPGLLRRATRAVKVFYNDYIATRLFPYELSAYDTVSMAVAVVVNSILVAMEGGDSSVETSRVKLYADRTVSLLCLLQVIVCTFMCVVYLTVLFPIHLYGAYKTKQRFVAGRARLNVDLAEVYANLTVGERWQSFVSWFEMQFRLLLLVFAVLSCAVSHYFAAFNLMLVVYSIPTLRTFISAITMNGRQLLLTSFMGVIMLYLFSIVGFLVFANQYDPDGDDGDPASAKSHMNCETLRQCFTYILDQGLRAGGGVGDVMLPWTWGNSRMLARLAYDMLFYALVTVVFLNILFGIIIDTFGQMRDEKREKETDMHGFCFICGLDADTLEKGSASGFANHVKQEHNMWMYLYYMHHLRRKEPSEYTGQESYVSTCIKRGGLNFFPEDNCVSLMEKREQEAAEQANALADGDDDDGNGDGANDKERGEAAGDVAGAASRAAMKELTVARETISAHLREWQTDSMRMKAILQQLELTSRSVAMDGGAASRRTGGSHNGGGGPGGAVSVRSGQTLPRSAKAETVAPSDVVAMEMQGSMGFAATASNANSCSGDNGGGARLETPALRAMQAQLQAEREMRQRYEAERRSMKELLRAREAELKKLKEGGGDKA